MSVEDRILKIVNLSKKEGYIDYNDINSVFPDFVFSSEELDGIHSKLHNINIEMLPNWLAYNFQSHD
jgi:hypothetical protein